MWLRALWKRRKRQRYISDELSHLVGRGMPPEEQYKLLAKIVNSGWLTHPPHNPSSPLILEVHHRKKISENQMYDPQVVCFCDIPKEEISLHARKYSPFGISFLKEFIVMNGGSPVHYLPRKAQARVGPRSVPLHEVRRMFETNDMEGLWQHADQGEYYNTMAEAYSELLDFLKELDHSHLKELGKLGKFTRLQEIQWFFDFNVFSRLKFFDHSLPDGDPENYYFEREWRIIGNLKFQTTDIRTVFLPAKYKKRFQSDLRQYKGTIHVVR